MNLTPELQREISIVFSVNDNYVPYLYICLQSLKAYMQADRSYHIYVLHTGIMSPQQAALRQLQTKQLHISFVNCKDLQNKLNTTDIGLTFHFTIETYYRFFLAELFPQLDKVLYLDADTIICQDIAPLFDTELGDNYIAATRDLEIIRAIHIPGSTDAVYFKDTLQLADIHNYFQAGVMVVNLKKWRQDNIQQKLIDRLNQIKTPMYVDQDVLNSVCQGHIKFVPQNWDYTWHLPFVDSQYTQTLPEPYSAQYQAARQDPYIIHFTGERMKPEDLPWLKEAQLFWSYAAQSPYFGELWQKMMNRQKQHIAFARANQGKLRRYKLLKTYLWGMKRQYYTHKYNRLYAYIHWYL